MGVSGIGKSDFPNGKPHFPPKVQVMKSTNQRLGSPATPPRGAPAPDDGGVLTRDELAKRLRVSTRTVSEWQRDRTIPYIKVGKVVLFYWPDVITHLRENYRVATAKSEPDTSPNPLPVRGGEGAAKRLKGDAP